MVRNPLSEALDVRGAQSRWGQALIDIEKQPALLVYLIGVGKPDGQVADRRAQHRVGLVRCGVHEKCRFRKVVLGAD